MTLLASAGAQDIKDCSDSDCILMMIGDNFSPLNTDQCKLHAPGLLDFGGDHFCGAFLDDTTGVVVSNVCTAVPVEPSECPVSMFDKEVYFMWGEGNYRATSERAKTSVYVGKGLPAASRLDRLMNFFTELFVSA